MIILSQCHPERHEHSPVNANKAEGSHKAKYSRSFGSVILSWRSSLTALRMTPIILIALILLTSAFPAQAKILDIKEVTSESGVTAWLVEDHSVPVIAMSFAFKDAGTINDSEDKQGLTRMASNTMDEGAGDLTSEEFQGELNNLSITLRYSAGRDNFGGFLQTLTKNKTRAFELTKLSLTQPRFDDDPVNRMREANKSRIRGSLGNPQWIAARIMNDKAFEGHPYAFNSGGTLTTLDSITREDLHEFVKSRLAKNNLKISVAGNITAKELAPVLDDIFGTLPDEAATQTVFDHKISNAGRTYIYNKDIPQSVIEIQQTGISHNDPAFHAAEILNYTLGGAGFGSRLMEEIREKRGLTYGIYSSFAEYSHATRYSVYTSTANENVPTMLSLIGAEFERFLENGITEKELEDAKNYLIGSQPLKLTSTKQIASALASMQMRGLPINYLDWRMEELRQTTVEDVNDAAKELLTPNQFLTVIVGSGAGLENTIELDTIPNAE